MQKNQSFIVVFSPLLGQGLKKSPIGQKLDFANHKRFKQKELGQLIMLKEPFTI
jgi:hypothetical protein